MLSAVIIALGVVADILFAEKIRKKFGTSNFYGRLLRTPELEIKDKENKLPIWASQAPLRECARSVCENAYHYLEFIWLRVVLESVIFDK